VTDAVESRSPRESAKVTDAVESGSPRESAKVTDAVESKSSRESAKVTDAVESKSSRERAKVTDAVVYWLGTTEEEVHFIDAIVSAYDGLANVRREYRLHDGRTEYKVFVAPGMESEFLELVERLRAVADITSVERESPNDEPDPPSETGQDR